jgi:hypothetical protein
MNILNLLIPDIIKIEEIWNNEENYLRSIGKYFANIIIQSIIYCFSIFVCYCSHRFSIDINPDKLVLSAIMIF